MNRHYQNILLYLGLSLAVFSTMHIAISEIEETINKYLIIGWWIVFIICIITMINFLIAILKEGKWLMQDVEEQTLRQKVQKILAKEQ